jgi:uncharacterized protein YdeI (YjbR/CyaY-like superfamily)
MATRTDSRVDAYIDSAADFAKPILRHIRKLVRQGCPEAEETLKWRSPTFVHEGKLLCGMAAFKEHCTFGFWHKAMEAELAKDGALEGGAMGSFGRITSVSDLPSDRKMLDYVRRAAKLNESGVPARPRPAATKPAAVEVPADLAAALKKNKAAAKSFEGFSPSCRREYVEWIAEAKREETRAKRLATTIEWLAEGKKRNWKYESC